MRIFSLAMSSCLLLLLLQACAGGQHPFGHVNDSARPVESELPSIASLDTIRDLAEIQQLNHDPHASILERGDVSQQGASLLLDSSAGPAAWALYSYAEDGSSLLNLAVDFSGNGASLLLGVADYSSGRWKFTAPYSTSPANFNLSSSGPDYVSPAGNLYFVVVSQGNQQLSIDGIRVLADVPPPPTFPVSGTVLDELSQPVASVSIALEPGGGQVLTDNAGSYSFPSVPAGSYMLTPTLLGYTFEPQERNLEVLAAAVTGMDFTASEIPVETYSISGNINDEQDAPMQSVDVTLMPGNIVVKTDANGDYSFSGILAGSYTVTPALAGFMFDPASRPADVIDSDLSGLDFTGSLIPTYSISGTVLDDGQAALQSVTVTLTPGGSQVSTDVNGFYEFSGLEAGSYTLTPSLTDYTFSPENRVVNLVDTSITDQDFTGTPDPVVSYSEDLLPIINGSMGNEYSCLPCHAGSFPQNGLDMLDYDDVVAFSASIQDRINRAQGSPGFMPNGKTKWQPAWLQMFDDWITGGFAP